ncbi:MAG: NUDIX hydrolase [Dermatophilaceae bacterium]
MTPVDKWNGRLAASLQYALRQSVEGFAHQLDISPRTVARWHAKPDTVPRPALQQILDHELATASTEVRRRFASFSGAESDRPSKPAAGLHVALAVVLNEGKVLLVRRREAETSAWQFPAGIVKPEASPEAVAVRETFAETGIDCAVRKHIGSRIHPATGVFCVYLLCEYLAGEPENRDPVENDSVRWASKYDIAKFIRVRLVWSEPVQAARDRSW